MSHEQEKIIEHYRQQINNIDREIFSLIKQREIMSSKIGQIKRDLKVPDRDFSREKIVFENAIMLAKEFDLKESFAVALQNLIIEHSLSRQEQDRIKNSFDEAKMSVVIVGGSGRLGKWFSRFFADSGHRVSVVDLVEPDFSCDFKTRLDESANNSDLIVVATPIRESIVILDQILSLKINKPVIFDVSSVKTPVFSSLKKLKNRGIKVTSLHPMFGPQVGLLFGKHIIRTSLGVDEADNIAHELFRATSLQMVDMSIDEHDAVISILLTLSHLLNIVFIRALRSANFPIHFLENFSSPTFSNLITTARKVMQENPHLYFEIQALNPHSKKAHRVLLEALVEVSAKINDGDEKGFVDIMKDGAQFLTSNA